MKLAYELGSADRSSAAAREPLIGTIAWFSMIAIGLIAFLLQVSADDRPRAVVAA
jgi:hypothetical protein